jgi:WD40 repeat protein
LGLVQGVHALAFSPDGTVLAEGSALTGQIKLLDVRDRKNLPKPSDIEAGGQSVSSVALSPDGQTLASGGESIMLWDIESWFLHYAGVADPCPGTCYGDGV